LIAGATRALFARRVRHHGLDLTELSIVIPTRGRAEQLARALRRLVAQSDAPAFEVVVVSDAADPQAEAVHDAVAASSLPARHLQATAPGASAARNVGWRATEAPVVLFLDDDVLATPPLVSEHAQVHASEPSVSVAVLGHLRWHPELHVTPFMRWLERGAQFEFHNIKGDNAGWGRFYTANVSVKRELLEAVDGFDAAAFPYLNEDLDLARRAHDTVGLVLRYRPAAVGDHLHAMTEADYARRLPKIASAEQQLVARYPDVRPYFHNIFTDAAQSPKARGRTAALTRIVRPDTPVIGPIAWKSFDMVLRQRLAPVYIAAWDAALNAEAEARGDSSAG
jgi:glycosyltransferase involved in cell wall biosynthesis